MAGLPFGAHIAKDSGLDTETSSEGVSESGVRDRLAGLKWAEGVVRLELCLSNRAGPVEADSFGMRAGCA